MKTKTWTCPYCGSKNFKDDCDYDIVTANDGAQYQYYATTCEDCGKKYYNVARYIGAYTKEEFEKLTKHDYGK